MRNTVANLATIDLNAVTAFVRVVEAGSFTAAAKKLALPKSAVSRRVARLEEMLGVRLLQRTTRRLTLTDEGGRYFARASEALAALDEATSDVGSSGAEPRGIVRFTAPSDFALVHLSEPLAKFAELYPAITVELIISSRVIDLVAEGIDFALRASRLQDSALVARRIASSPLVLAAAPSYLDRRGTPRSPHDLAEHDCVLFRPEGGRARWPLVGPGREERTVTVTGKIASDDFDFIRSLIVNGAGIGLLPWQFSVDDATAPRLVRVLPEWHGPIGTLSMVYPRTRYVPRRVSLLRDFLYDYLRGLQNREPPSAWTGT